jgi:uncharacterized protein
MDVVRRIYAAWEEGRSAGPYMHADIEYVNPDDAVEPGTLLGRKAFGRVRDVLPEFRLEVEELIDAGDEVVVIATARGQAPGSGIETQWRQGHVWQVRDGLAVRFRWFTDVSRALAAAGLRE